jgi:hypothetical protein
LDKTCYTGHGFQLIFENCLLLTMEDTMMVVPDEGSLYQKMGIPFDMVIRKLRLDTRMEHEEALRAYLAQGGEPDAPLSFHLTAGQPVYNFFGSEFQRVSDAESPLAVYLDPKWIDTWFLPDYLFINATALDTSVVRIDFAGRPHFDPDIYNRLPLEAVFQSMQKSNARSYEQVMTLYQLRKNRTLLWLRHRSSLPPLGSLYDFLGLHPLL